jgi:hypothetical protein
MHFLTYLLVPQLVSALAISQRDDCDQSTQLRALYMLDSNPAGSTVIAFKINEEDGSLSDQVVTPTGQLGEMGLLIDLVDPNGAPAVAGADPLYSQDALIVYDDVSLSSISVMEHQLIGDSSIFSLSMLGAIAFLCSPLTQRILQRQP